MLTKQELNQIEQFKSENSTLKYLFDKIEREYQYEMFQISHNIRNQLTLIMSSFPFIEHDLPEVNDSRYWNTCVNGANGLHDFLEQLSDYHQSTNIRRQVFDLDLMLTNFVQTLPCRICPHSVSATLEIQDSCPALNGDARKLSHALKLLLRNSCEAFTDDTYKISIILSRTDSHCRISISDSRQNTLKDTCQKTWDPYAFDSNHFMELNLRIANNIILAHEGFLLPAQTGTTDTGLDIYLPLITWEK